MLLPFSSSSLSPMSSSIFVLASLSSMSASSISSSMLIVGGSLGIRDRGDRGSGLLACAAEADLLLIASDAPPSDCKDPSSSRSSSETSLYACWGIPAYFFRSSSTVKPSSSSTPPAEPSSLSDSLELMKSLSSSDSSFVSSLFSDSEVPPSVRLWSIRVDWASTLFNSSLPRRCCSSCHFSRRLASISTVTLSHIDRSDAQTVLR